MEAHGFKFDLQRRRAARERFHDPGPAPPACGDGRPIRPEPLEPPMRERHDGAAGLRRERDVDLGLPRPAWIPPREHDLVSWLATTRGPPERATQQRDSHSLVARYASVTRSSVTSSGRGPSPEDESTSSIDTVNVEDRDGPRPPAGRMRWRRSGSPCSPRPSRARTDPSGATGSAPPPLGAYFFLPISTFTRWLARFAPRGTTTSRMPLS